MLKNTKITKNINLYDKKEIFEMIEVYSLRRIDLELVFNSIITLQ